MAAFDEVAEALARIAKSGDDWGWKGGKPGELTGQQLEHYFARHVRTGERKVDRLVPKSQQRVIKQAEKQLKRFKEKYPNSPVALGLSGRTDWGIEDMGYLFSELERAGIPRAWTARVAAALPNDIKFRTYGIMPDSYLHEYAGKWTNPEILGEISNAMRPMTDAQRETFLSLLPRWTGTLEQAANAAKKLYRRPS